MLTAEGPTDLLSLLYTGSCHINNSTEDNARAASGTYHGTGTHGGYIKATIDVLCPIRNLEINKV